MCVGGERSSIPTLVLTGQYDPITPPSLGKLAARTLLRSFFYTFPGRGHGQDFDPNASCPETITTQFLHAPTRAPDAGCIQAMTGPTFR